MKAKLSSELLDLKNLEESSSLFHAQLLRKIKIQEDLLHLYEKEEDYWHQRSIDNWLLQGYNNTDYFHRIANGHKRNKTIFSLQDRPRTIQGTPDLLRHATSFYKNLFGPQVTAGTRLREYMWSNGDELSEQ
jgi:hypothetical protein